MKKFTLFTILFFSFTKSWSQSMNVETKATTIQNSFDKVSLQAYAVQANTKVDELFEYLNFISKTDNSSELGKQLAKNIRQLFTNEKPILLEGLDNPKRFYSVQEWLNDYENGKITIEKWELLHSKLEDDRWQNQYQLIYTVNGKRKIQKIDIEILLQPTEKAFGKTQKKVWEMKLGNIEVK